MNDKKEPPRRKTIPRQMVMKEAFELNYRGPSIPPECVGCKNSLGLSCEGCEHWPMRMKINKDEKLLSMPLSNLKTPAMVRHDIVDNLMAEKHSLEEELDGLSTEDDRWDELRGRIIGLEQAICIVREK